MSAFVLPAELPAHKISCCVYCSLNKSPHLFSTISTTYHYSTIVYFTHCYVELLVLIILCRCISFCILHTLFYHKQKHMSLLYCQFSVSAMNLNSQYFFCFEYLLIVSSIYSRNVLLRIKMKQIVIWTWRVNYDNLNQIQSTYICIFGSDHMMNI